MKKYWLLIVPLLVIIIDQITKISALKYLFLDKSLAITAWFNFTLSYNRGSAFSFLRNASGWQNGLFICTAILASLLILRWFFKLPKDKTWFAFGLMLIMGGALGNLIDRFWHGYVIDFLDFHIYSWHWPVFNLADSAIVVGTFLFLILSFCDKTNSNNH